MDYSKIGLNSKILPWVTALNYFWSKDINIIKFFSEVYLKSLIFWLDKENFPIPYLCLNIQLVNIISFLENLTIYFRFSSWRQTCEKASQLKTYLLKRLSCRLKSPSVRKCQLKKWVQQVRIRICHNLQLLI